MSDFQLGLTLRAFEVADAAEGWWLEPDALPRIAAAVENAGLGLPFRGLGPTAGTPIRGTSMEALARDAAAPEMLTVDSGANFFLGRSARKGTRLRVGVWDRRSHPRCRGNDKFFLSYTLKAEQWRQFNGDVVDLCVALTLAVRAALPGTVTLGDQAALLPDLDYPRPSPPRFETRWGMGAALTVLDPEFHRTAPAGRLAYEADLTACLRLIEAPTPPECRRFERDGWWFFRWVEDLSDPDEVRRRLGIQEAWTLETAGSPLEAPA